MRIRNGEIKALIENLAKYAQTTHPKIAYFVSVNALRARKCLEEAEKLTNDGWPTDAWKAWQEASKSVVEAHAARDENDAIIWDDVPGGKRIRIADGAAFDAEVAELQKEHPKAMADLNAHNARAAEIANAENEFREHKLSAQVAADAGVLTAESLAYFMRIGLIDEE